MPPSHQAKCTQVRTSRSHEDTFNGVYEPLLALNGEEPVCASKTSPDKCVAEEVCGVSLPRQQSASVISTARHLNLHSRSLLSSAQLGLQQPRPTIRPSNRQCSGPAGWATVLMRLSPCSSSPGARLLGCLLLLICLQGDHEAANARRRRSSSNARPGGAGAGCRGRCSYRGSFKLQVIPPLMDPAALHLPCVMPEYGHTAEHQV